MTIVRCLTLLVVLAASLAMPSSSGAVIQLQRGIAGARLGNTQKQVRAALGRPARVHKGHNELAGDTTTFRYRFGLQVQFAQATGGHVAAVTLTGRTDRTPGGVGVGTRESVLRAHIGNATCSTRFGVRTCTVGVLAAGRPVTTFFMRRGAVRRVSVALLLD